MARKTLQLILASCLVLLGFNASASENAFQQFYEQQNSAYASYRVALFQTNRKEQNAALKGINNFSKEWENIVLKFADAPPEIFANDAKWKSTLTKISDIASTGKQEIEAGKLSEAHGTLEEIRDEYSDLRRRNHLVFFSDYINNYHEAMEQLLLTGYSADKIDSDKKNVIREQLAVMEYLSERVVQNAPAHYRANKVYIKLQASLITSLKNLRAALDSDNPDAISKAIKGLKPAYAKLFVKFG